MVECVSPYFNGRSFFNLRCYCLQSCLNCKKYNVQHNAVFSLCQLGFWNVPLCEYTCRLRLCFDDFSPRGCVFR